MCIQAGAGGRTLPLGATGRFAWRGAWKWRLNGDAGLAGAGAASSEGAVSGLAGGFLGATGSGRVTPICQMASPHRLRQLLWLREAPPEAFLAVQLRERTPSQPCDRACRFRAPKMPCVEVGPTVRTRRCHDVARALSHCRRPARPPESKRASARLRSLEQAQSSEAGHGSISDLFSAAARPRKSMAIVAGDRSVAPAAFAGEVPRRSRHQAMAAARS